MPSKLNETSVENGTSPPAIQALYQEITFKAYFIYT